MPIFAALFKAAFLWIAGFLSNVMWYIHMVSWARRAFIVTLGVTFFAAVGTCASALLGGVSSALAGAPARFAQGVGMFIPSNAVAVLSCVATVWLACVVYRLKLEALRW